MVETISPLLPKGFKLRYNLLFVFIIRLYVTTVRSYPFIDIQTANLNQNQGFKAYAGNSNINLGYSVSSAGDFNQDGFDDVAIGTQDPTNIASVYILYGNNAGISNIDLLANPPSSIGRGLTLSAEQPGDSFGASVANIGDFNLDGVDDIMIGAPYNYGNVYIVFGRKGGIPDTDVSNLAGSGRGFRLSGALPSYSFGTAVSSAGDFNHDGYGDIMVSDPISRIVYIIYNQQSGYSDIDLMVTGDLASTGLGFKILGRSQDTGFGYSISQAGDVNGDGVDDIIIGSLAGSVFVIFGSAAIASDLDLNIQLAPTSGFIISSDSWFGWSVSSAGDINQDGISDVIIGSGQEPPGGAVYIIFGSKNMASDVDMVASNYLPPPDRGCKISGPNSGGQFGTSVAGTGNFSGNGTAGVVIGDLVSASVYVLFGSKNMSNLNLNTVDLASSQTGFTIFGPVPSLGNAVANAGDINGDGVSDIIVGARSEDNNYGAAYVLFGGGTTVSATTQSSMTCL